MRVARTHTHPTFNLVGMNAPPTVLVAADPDTCPNVARAMSGLVRVRTARTREQALAQLSAASQLDVLVTELRLADGPTGLDLLAEVRRQAPGVLRILVARRVDAELDTAIADGLVEWLVEWPWTPAELMQPLCRGHRSRYLGRVFP
jgi:CheY-like chemotaxis protein